MSSNLSFSAQVDSWVRATNERMVAVFRSSSQDVVAEMQKVGPSVASTKAAIAASGKRIGPVVAAGEGGNMPVDFGFLRASLVASNDTMPLPIRSDPTPGVKHDYEARDVNLVIAGTQIGQPLYVGYTANYAGFVEYGTSKMAPRAFVRLAAMQWQAIVDRNIVKAKNVALGGFARLTKYD